MDRSHQENTDIQLQEWLDNLGEPAKQPDVDKIREKLFDADDKLIGQYLPRLLDHKLDLLVDLVDDGKPIFFMIDKEKSFAKLVEKLISSDANVCDEEDGKELERLESCLTDVRLGDYNTVLHVYAREDRPPDFLKYVLSQLAECGCNMLNLLRATNQHGHLPFHLTSDLEALTGILQEGDRKLLLQSRSATGESLLHTARNKNVVRTVFNDVQGEERKKLILTTTSYGQSVLHTARKGEIVNEVLKGLDSRELKIKLLKMRSHLGYTALHTAITGDVVRELLAPLKDTPQDIEELITSKCNEGQTPFHTARNGDVMKALLEFLTGTATNVFKLVDKVRKTPLHTAKSDEVVELLLSDDMAENRVEWIKTLDSQGRTPLHLACDDTVAAALLNKLPCEDVRNIITIPDRSGHTSLHTAKNGEIAKVLLSKFGTPEYDLIEMEDKTGKTCLHTAREGVIAAVLGKLDKGDKKDDLIMHVAKNGLTALHLVKCEQDAEALIDGLSSDDKRRQLLRSADGILGVNALVWTTKSNSERAALTARSIAKRMAKLNMCINEVDSNQTHTDDTGQNYLHVVHKLGLSNHQRKVSKSEITYDEAAQQDYDGNTPLHYAAAWEARSIFETIAGMPGSNLKFHKLITQVENKKGYTALDLARKLPSEIAEHCDHYISSHKPESNAWLCLELQTMPQERKEILPYISYCILNEYPMSRFATLLTANAEIDFRNTAGKIDANLRFVRELLEVTVDMLQTERQQMPDEWDLVTRASDIAGEMHHVIFIQLSVSCKDCNSEAKTRALKELTWVTRIVDKLSKAECLVGRPRVILCEVDFDISGVGCYPLPADTFFWIYHRPTESRSEIIHIMDCGCSASFNVTDFLRNSMEGPRRDLFSEIARFRRQHHVKCSPIASTLGRRLFPFVRNQTATVRRPNDEANMQSVSYGLVQQNNTKKPEDFEPDIYQPEDFAAAIFYNTVMRPSAKDEKETAKRFFCQQIGIQPNDVVEERNWQGDHIFSEETERQNGCSSKSIKRRIAEFLEKYSEKKVLFLCIMSHGVFENIILGNSPATSITVDEIIAQFKGQQNSNPNQVKVLIIQSCRGGNNPMVMAHSEKRLLELVFTQGSKLSRSAGMKPECVYKSLHIPQDFFVIFPNLRGCKTGRHHTLNAFEVCMKRRRNLDKHVDWYDLVMDVVGFTRTGAYLGQQMEYIDNLTQPLVFDTSQAPGKTDVDDNWGEVLPKK